MNCRIALVCFTLLIGSINAALKSRIVGGDDADIKTYPYQASIRIRGNHICGGSIISKRHILTVAHCITRKMEFVRPYNDVSISTGSDQLSIGGASHRIATVMIHPGWSDTHLSGYVNDVAVITIVNQIRFNLYEKMIRLPHANIITQRVGVLTGWGTTVTNTRTMSNKLQRLEMLLLDHKECSDYYSGYPPIHEKQFCAYQRPDHGSCIGDSGSPLVSGNEVIGVLSFITGNDCAAGTVEVFTNVFTVKSFIDSAMT